MDAKTKAEIDRKIALGIPLSGDQNGSISSENLAYWQAQMTARAAHITADTTHQSTGSGVGTVNSSSSNIIPDVTASTVKGYGYTAIVGVGVAMIATSLLFGFRRVRGR